MLTCSQPIEYVDKWLHLGHTICNDLDDKCDLIQCRNALAGQINSQPIEYVDKGL
jgi:hypothetical protein